MNGAHADVLVLGLGPAGAAAAAKAARRGCRVLALDRKRIAGVPVQCAEFVPALIGTQVSCLSDATRQPIRAMMTFVEDAPPDEQPRFPGHMLDRAAFDAGLVEEAVRAGAQCRFGTRVRRVTRSGAVELSNGETLSAPVVIGADGPLSSAGRAIGQANTEVVETRQITVPLARRHDATDIFLSARIPGGYGWLFPKGDVANLGAGVAPPYKARLKRIVADLHETLIARGRVGVEVSYLTGGRIPVGGMKQCADTLERVLVLLAGDAGGLTHPITGAGIAAAVQSGKLAGEAAASWLSGNTRADSDYQDELEALFKPALDRAVHRRRELLAALAAGAPAASVWRRTWIAYPEYWAA